MQWKIVGSNLSGPIEIGENADTVKAILGEPNDQFKRTPDSEDSVVAYDDVGLHIVYDHNGLISQLTVFPQNEVYIGTIQLLNKPIEYLYTELQNAGTSVEREGTGLWCEKQKIFLVEVEGVIDGVEIYRD